MTTDGRATVGRRTMSDAADARVAQLEAEVRQLREQQTAAAEVLRVIASSPADVQQALQAIVETAARLCDAPSANLLQMREPDGRLVPRAVVGWGYEHMRPRFEDRVGILATL